MRTDLRGWDDGTDELLTCRERQSRTGWAMWSGATQRCPGRVIAQGRLEDNNDKAWGTVMTYP